MFGTGWKLARATINSGVLEQWRICFFPPSFFFVQAPFCLLKEVDRKGRFHPWMTRSLFSQEWHALSLVSKETTGQRHGTGWAAQRDCATQVVSLQRKNKGRLAVFCFPGLPSRGWKPIFG